MNSNSALLLKLVVLPVLSHFSFFTNKRHIPETKQDSTEDNSERINRDLIGVEDEEILWLQMEATMKARESYAIETLENLGVVAEGDDDEDSEESQLWKVVEGKAQLAEVVLL